MTANINSEKTILLVDDIEGVRTSLGLILEGEGYKIKLASNGVEAMEILAQSSDTRLYPELG